MKKRTTHARHDFPLEGDEEADEAAVRHLLCNQAMDNLNLVSEHGGCGVAAVQGEMTTLGVILPPLKVGKASKEEKVGKAASLGTHLFFTLGKADESGALSIPLEESLLSCSIIHPSAVSQETEDPAVHSIHPGEHASPSKWCQQNAIGQLSLYALRQLGISIINLFCACGVLWFFFYCLLLNSG